jgi:hypothetical protein
MEPARGKRFRIPSPLADRVESRGAWQRTVFRGRGGPGMGVFDQAARLAAQVEPELAAGYKRRAQTRNDRLPQPWCTWFAAC